jgi:DNA-binding beta-propeller fold protein YncE
MQNNSNKATSRFAFYRVLALIILVIGLLPVLAHAKPKSSDFSDLNQDGIVDLVDLEIFSERQLETSVENVDWCAFYEAVSKGERFQGEKTGFIQKRYKLLLGFIYDNFKCGVEPNLLAIQNIPKNLTRVAVDSASTGNYYISDPIVGSVFIFNPEMTLIGELKNLDRPLGVAIDTQGYLLVGNDGRDNIEVYDPANGDLLASFGDGLVQMPTAITVGPGGDIYVTDSRSHQVQVFEASYLPVRTIGTPGSGDDQLKFPLDAVIISRQDNGALIEEIYIADQGNHRIQVYDLQGNFKRTINPPTVLSSMCTDYGFSCPKDARGTFNRLQALGADTYGRLHILDVFEAAGSILDPVTGAVIASYGGWGDGLDLLRVPMDLLVTGAGQAIVTDSESNEIETFAVPVPQP